MTNIRLSHHMPQVAVEPDWPGKEKPPTVASIGMHVRLVPADADRDVARLIASCDALRAECERLHRQVQDLLHEDAREPEARSRAPRSPTE